MKTIKSLALACALTFSGTAFAQFANTGGSSSASGDYTGYNRIGISYNNTHLGHNKYAGGKNSNISLNGVGLDYIHGFSLTDRLPLFLETGVNLNFNFGSKDAVSTNFGDYEDFDEEDWGDFMDDVEDGDIPTTKTKYQNINMQIPVNLVYRFNINENFSIAPYFGLNFKVHFTSKYKTELPSYDEEGDYGYEGYAYDYGYDDEYDYGTDDNDGSKWISNFDKKQVGKNNTWNRFQMGWHVGVGFQYKPFYLGVQYGTDFIAAYSHKKSKINTGNLKISLAYCF